MSPSAENVYSEDMGTEQHHSLGASPPYTGSPSSPPVGGKRRGRSRSRRGKGKKTKGGKSRKLRKSRKSRKSRK